MSHLKNMRKILMCFVVFMGRAISMTLEDFKSLSYFFASNNFPIKDEKSSSANMFHVCFFVSVAYTKHKLFLSQFLLVQAKISVVESNKFSFCASCSLFYFFLMLSFVVGIFPIYTVPVQKMLKL